MCSNVLYSFYKEINHQKNQDNLHPFHFSFLSQSDGELCFLLFLRWRRNVSIIIVCKIDIYSYLSANIIKINGKMKFENDFNND